MTKQGQLNIPAILIRRIDRWQKSREKSGVKLSRNAAASHLLDEVLTAAGFTAEGDNETEDKTGVH